MLDLSEQRMFYQERVPINQLYGLDELCKKHLNKEMVGCEIGSFSGVSSRLISSYIKELYCIDLWGAYPEVPAVHMARAEQIFDENKPENIIKVKKDSSCLSEFEDGFFDFIYIDGWHKYQQVKNEIELALKKIKKGGIIAGHDYNQSEVARAVNEFFKVEVYSDSSWCAVC